MKIRSALLAFAVAGVLGSTETLAQNAYVPNIASNTVSVIDTATNAIIKTIPVGIEPGAIGVAPHGSRVYVGNCGYGDSSSVSVIDGTTNSVIATVPVGSCGGIAVSPDGSKAYVTNGGNTLSIIEAKTNAVAATVTVPLANAFALAVSPNGSRLYITDFVSNSVAVLDTATNGVIATIFIGDRTDPFGVAVSPDGSKVYVADYGSADVSVINAATNVVTNRIPIPGVPGIIPTPYALAVTPDGTRVYVTILNGTFVSVIDTATNAVIDSVTVGTDPDGVDVTPDGKRVYVVNDFGPVTDLPPGSVSVIDTATNTVTATIAVGGQPIAFGVFIPRGKPGPSFAGTPGKSNCHGKSVSALTGQYGGLNNAASALGYPSVSALQNAIEDYCEA